MAFCAVFCDDVDVDAAAAVAAAAADDYGDGVGGDVVAHHPSAYHLMSCRCVFALVVLPMLVIWLWPFLNGIASVAWFDSTGIRLAVPLRW